MKNFRMVKHRKTDLSNSASMMLGVAVILALTLPANAGSWSTKSPMPFARNTPAVESINGIVYVAGGDDVTEQASLQAYNPVANTWTTMSPMPAGRYSGDGAGVINGQLYVAGGWDNTITRLPHDTLFVYNPATNRWTTKAPMPHLSGCGATGTINNKLYVTTACDGFSGFRNFLDVYTPSTNTWTSLAASNSAHSGPAFGVISGEFYVGGGEDNNGTITSTFEVYNPASNTWTRLANMPIPVINPGSAALNGKLYVFGGTTDFTGTTTTAVQVYDPVKASWSVPPSGLMPTPRGGLVGGAVAYGVIFAEGGSNSTGVLSTNQLFFNCPTIP